MKNAKCPKCGGGMEDGFLIDRSQHNSADQATWANGEPERYWFGSIKMRGRERYQVRTQRCTRCGLLESFALERTK